MMMFRMKRKLMWIIILSTVLILGIVLMFSAKGGVSSEAVKVTKGDIKQYIEDTAEVLSNEKQTVYVEGSGNVTGLNVDVGDTVKQGDLLLSLDKSELELQLKDAQAKIEASMAQLKGTELINYANKIELAKAAVVEAQISYDSVRRNYENAKNLFESQAISRDEFEKTQNEYKSSQAALNKANIQVEDLKQGTPDYVKSGYQAQLEQAVIYRDTIKRNLQKQEIRAQMDGVIIEKHVEKNSPVSAATVAFVIGNINLLELEADLLADDINKVKIEALVEISGKPLNDVILKGKVVKIAPAAKTVTSNLGVNQKRVPVTIEMTDTSSALKPGYNIDVKIIVDIKNDIIKVPVSAVFDYKGKSNVFVVNAGKALLKEVKKGIESENYIEIQEGLKEGELILLKPDNNIKEGTKIKALNKK